jgi:hypothetical protein
VERIVVGRSATLTKTFSTAPTGTPTVAVTDSAGLPVTVGSVSGAGTDWTYTIPSTSLLQTDTLLEVWTATMGGQPQAFADHIEVAGDVLFTLAEFRALGSAYANTTNYPDKTVADMRTTVEQALEDACSVAFVPRYSVETVNGVYGGLLSLRWARVRSIRTVTIDDLAGTPADYVALREGMVYASSTWWTAGYGNVTVGYEHGYDTPPSRIKRAALILAKRWITPGSADDRAINVTNDSGTYALFQAGVRGHLFDVPEVQAAVDQYNLSVGVA